ncbi:hypothetical protein B0H10DRAFT_1812243 [Mycena sp. CBHHK59/15]|nr:hypothetical protein B0H10DRAFT_1812243 [Mycena sp. CBHHK59/15]
MNPWCPTSPGQHGYMFVGLGRENNTFLQPEHLSLFFSRLEVTYLGLYEVCRVAPLTIAEWKTLSSCVQHQYSITTSSKGSAKGVGTHVGRGPAQIRADYDSGLLSVPCVRLKCIGFDETLYAGLLVPTGGRKRKAGSVFSDGRPKRRQAFLT